VMCDITTLAHLNWQFDPVLADFDFSCLTVEILNKKPIYKYCPACLASDPTPYFRQSWRLASTYICPLHRMILRDSCHQCKQRIDLSLSNPRSDGSNSLRCLSFCNQCKASLAESPCNTIGRRFLSDVFFRQEQIENLIRSTSSYWMPSQFAIHHESLSDQHPSKLVWSVANAQVILKGLVESYGDILKRTQIRIENRLILKSLMHLKEYDFFPYTYYSNGIYIALDGPSIFKCISPVIGLQISEYQSPNGSTIWWEKTVGNLENSHKTEPGALSTAISWFTSSSSI